MNDNRTSVTVAYEPNDSERFGVTACATAGDEFTLDALQTTVNHALREAVADVLALYAAADRQAASTKENPSG